VGIIAHMKAESILHKKDKLPDGGIVEFAIWKVPTPIPPTTHGYKYRLVYIRNGVRVVGFDNERGKGDHMHLDGQELPYVFTDVAQLIEDFMSEVKKRKAT